MNHISSTYDAPASFPVVLGTSCEFCQSKPFCCTYQLRDPSVETRALFLHWLQSCEDPCCVQFDNKHCKLRSYECLILLFHVNRILVHELSKTLFTNVHHRFAAAWRRRQNGYCFVPAARARYWSRETKRDQTDTIHLVSRDESA